MSNQDPNLSREQEKYENPVPSREFILTHLQERSKPANYAQLCEELAVNDEERQIAFKRRLRAMERDGQLYFNKFKCYALIDEAGLTKGKVIGHRDGFGFLEVEGESKDWFIAKHQMNMVLHGDIVLAKGTKRGSGSKCDARIIKVLTNERAPIVGRYFVEHGVAVVVAEDPRITQDIMILPGNENGARHNQMVQVKITQNPSRNMNAVGKVVDVLGEHLAPGMEIEVALRNHDIPHVWPEEVDAQVAHLGEFVEDADKQGRVDLRDLPLVTIDGEDARDFDDAVYCEPKKSGGWRLWVAIADVSHYVGMNTPLNKEAIARGNSVYFPEQVIPMLPKVLSNGLCSLNPKVDRLCMVAEMTISAAGKLSGYKFYPAVMHSHARLTYTQVADMLEGGEVSDKLKPIFPHLQTLQSLYLTLDETRAERGAIAFETTETQIIFGKDRKIENIKPTTRNDAHRIIEECMVTANMCAARFLKKHKIPALHRVHRGPEVEKLFKVNEFLNGLGLKLGGGAEPQPSDYAELLASVKERPDARLIQTVMLRSMSRAAYEPVDKSNPESTRHFGLARKDYAHFTSPIRRYPDVMVHRLLQHYLDGGKAVNQEELEEKCKHSSEKEKAATEAERASIKFMQVKFMQDKVGEVFGGVVSGVSEWGLYVQITDNMCEGMVRLSDIGDDYYSFDAPNYCAVGKNTGQEYRMGDEVKIKVRRANLVKKQLDFELV